MSSGGAAAWMNVYTPLTCGKFTWTVTRECLIYRRGEDRKRGRAKKRTRRKEREIENVKEGYSEWEGWGWGGAVRGQCNYVSLQWQV